ncbi:uncharacterized protein LOC118202624 [Stegodyphus dumicola]|uniref:uncharacterized protein LOC118202624 n=1 Tax=Stegodyphus dumicola TaxID=202533 RepID=UPI0015A7A77A|nr:uncharacterized protein LOC118202624 [Stegodyphus dumicola]
MGKIKHKRYLRSSNSKLMIKCPMSGNEDASNKLSENLQFKADAVNSNIFRNVPISSNIFNQKLLDVEPEKKSPSKKTLKNLRRKMQKESLPLVTRRLLQEKYDNLKQKQTILENYDAMKDALCSLESREKERLEVEQKKPRTSKPFQVQQVEMMRDMKTYHVILQNQCYVKDPFQTILSLVMRKVMSGSI